MKITEHQIKLGKHYITGIVQFVGLVLLMFVTFWITLRR